jgi:arginase family enzyme
MDRFILNPHLRLSHYANQYFIYDARVTEHPLVEIPTQAISEDEYSTLHKLKTHGILLEGQSKEDVLAYFTEEHLAPEYFESLLQRNFLKPYVSRAESVQNRVLDFFNARYAQNEDGANIKTRPPYEEDDANLHLFSPRTFFNLPRSVEPEACHVGLLGVPQSSLNLSLGTEAAPFHFRSHSRSHCWFEIYEHGIYSETNIEADRPVILCKDVVLRDCGNLDFQNMTLLQMVDEVRQTLVHSFFSNNTYPVILGGDHAITYPIILTYLEMFPDLGLLHFDAHNDLFYSPKLEYSHATPISNLVRNTDISRVVSFGLRTFSDSRVHNVRSIYEKPDSSERLKLYSLTSVKQLIMTSGSLEQELETLSDRPYYLTVDLDVLSESAIGHQLATPCGVGMEWHELLYFLDLAFRKLNIIGCDLVEYDSTHGGEGGRNQSSINALLLLMIDGLARNNPKPKRNSKSSI